MDRKLYTEKNFYQSLKQFFETKIKPFCRICNVLRISFQKKIIESLKSITSSCQLNIIHYFYVQTVVVFQS